MLSMPSPVAALMHTVPSPSRADATARTVSGAATASILFQTVTWPQKWDRVRKSSVKWTKAHDNRGRTSGK